MSLSISKERGSMVFQNSMCHSSWVAAIIKENIRVHFFVQCELVINLTRMHSSRMRTGRSLTVCRSLLPGGGLLLGGLLLGGSAWGGGYPSMHWGRPPLWTESQTPVKTLPWPNFVAAGNKHKCTLVTIFFHFHFVLTFTIMILNILIY